MKRKRTTWLGCDIGGANLKMASADGFTCCEPFALWKSPAQLAGRLAGLVSRAPNHQAIAITMTGELADCYANKTEGVQHILDAAERSSSTPIFVYLTDGRFVPPAEARNNPLACAASNWHALASFATRYTAKESSLIIDIGSTTSDIIPTDQGRLLTTAKSDTERLALGQLVYTGIERSPVCAVTRSVFFRHRKCRVAQELFATMKDVYTVLGERAEDEEDCDTADGKPSTRRFALARLARCICCDNQSFTWDDALGMAAEIRTHQVRDLLAAVSQVISEMPRNPTKVVLCGSGEVLAQRTIMEMPRNLRPEAVLSLGEEMGAERSRCAPALAVACLAEEASTARFPV